MKRKFTFIFLGVIGIFALLAYNNNANGIGDLSNKKISANLTNRQKENYNSVMKKLNSAWLDIKKDLKNDNIDLTEYMQIDLQNLSLFSNGDGHITDKDKIKSILKSVIYPSLAEEPNGSLEPLILINKDGDKVLFCYKLENGSNIIKKYSLENKKWTSVYKETKGELPLSINIIS